MAMPLVSLVVLNHNAQALLQVCLDAVFGQTYEHREVIVVDNGSADGSPEMVRRRFPGARLLVNPLNAGYARAANQGIRCAAGEFVAVLNNDTRMDSDWLQKLVEIVLSDERIGSCSSRQMDFYRPGVVDSEGLALRRGLYPASRNRGQAAGSASQAAGEVFGAAGASALYRAAALRQAGLFDEDYFAYNEEFDLAVRLRLAGWKCLYVPAATVYHVSGATRARRDRRFLVFYMERNRLCTILKDMPLRVILRQLPYLLKYEWDILMRLCLRREAAPLLARLDFLRLAPVMLAKRGRVQAMRRIAVEDLEQWIGRED